MALDETEQRIGQLGTELAQTHYANTGDNDGPLPWLPTDPDRQKLVDMLGRAATLDEERLFESGYRESMMRLDGNANNQRPSALFYSELFATLRRHGYATPPPGTPEREEAELELWRVLQDVRQNMGDLEQRAVPRDLDPAPEEGERREERRLMREEGTDALEKRALENA